MAEVRWLVGLAACLLTASACAPEARLGGGVPNLSSTTPDNQQTAVSTMPASGPRGVAGAPTPQSNPPHRTPPQTPVRFGVAVEGASPGRLAALESLAGAEVGVVRVFTRWDTDFPTDNHRALLADGRRIHLSVRPRTDAGLVIPWAEVAAAQPGTPVYERLDEWTRLVASYGSQIYFTLNHEPETADSAANGTPAEFVAAWRRTVELLRANGGAEVPTVLVLGRGAYASGSISLWYPGDDVVDVVGVDPYNWYLCQGTERPWVSPGDLIEPALNFAIDHDKPLAIPEIASTEDPADPDRKAAWIDELGETLASSTVAPHLEYAAWFSVSDRGWPNCEWEYNSSVQSAEALTGLIAWFG